MPSKKKPTKTTSTISKEELLDPAALKDGSSTTYIGGWSSYETVESVSAVSAQVTAAHTGADGAVAALPRTNIFLLPTQAGGATTTTSDDDAAAVDGQPPVTVVVVDQMNLEGVSRQLCGRAQSAVKTWAAPATATSRVMSAEAGQQSPPPPPSDVGEEEPREPVNPFADALHDVRYSQTVPVGATFSARDVVVHGSCSIEGLPPKIVVPPQLPTQPDLDAVTLDEEDGAAGEQAGAAAPAGKSAKPSSAAKKNAKKGKPKLTPEQLEELERKKALVEAAYLQQTEQAVQRAQEEADHLMTFAHPNRWATVVFRHVTFAGPVVVRRAHVSFQNCCFVSAVADRPQLLVSQYCRVSCTKCTFEAPRRCGVYALPSAQVTARKCLFTGAAQAVLWASDIAGLTPQAGGTAADINADDVNAESLGLDDDGGESGGANAAAKKSGGGLTAPIALVGGVKEAIRTAHHERSGAVGIQTDSAKLHAQSCAFLGLGVGVYVRGSYSVYVSHRALAPRSAQQLTPDVCDIVMDTNAFHHFANTAVLLDKTTRLVGLRRNFVSACAHYGLDCQGGSKSVLVRGNHFTADAVVRIREGANVALLHNDFQSIPVNDNVHDNPCLQPVY